MGWTDRLNATPGRIRLGPVDVDVYHWAEMADTVVNPPHRHTYFELCWVEDGAGEFIVDGRTHPIGPGSLLFARPGVPHQIISRHEPGIRLAWVAFHLRLTGDDGDLGALFDAFSTSARPLAHDAQARVAALWTALRATGAGPALPGQDAAATSVAQALLVALAQAGADALRPQTAVAPDAGAAVVRQATRYVQDNLDRPLSVEELARHVHLSPRQLTRLFTLHVGQSPAGYVERTRLDHAAALLVRTDLPIKQIADAVGYGDVPGFTRAFSRRLGTPPGRFRHAATLQPVLSVS
ncbi:AraC family transcriptional regulator [Phytohabitans rumicis]|uniref:AraC family transcriptional regulator n=1 Tax=Phytohabitans rumicis TaxID=1076125 RepID=A0A6V8LJC9_9ACTN|nr:helix-turn-helix domain-containing protein [Phytohabitans rumicis]GFJ92725.1 AraC family transcriptional regulator [Phytohabitans rumicis]